MTQRQTVTDVTAVSPFATEMNSSRRRVRSLPSVTEPYPPNREGLPRKTN